MSNRITEEEKIKKIILSCNTSGQIIIAMKIIDLFYKKRIYYGGFAVHDITIDLKNKAHNRSIEIKSKKQSIFNYNYC